jgi:hypothetical protein
MDIDWPLELLRLDACQIGSYLKVVSRPGGMDEAFDEWEDSMDAYNNALTEWANRPVPCVACDGTGTDPVWGYCLICDGHKVTTPGLRATLQSVKALNLAVAASHHLVADRLRREINAYHEAQDKRLGLDGHWDV